MLLIDCPHCGERPEIEFVYAGEAHLVRPGADCGVTDEAWAEYLYFRRNLRGSHAERWRHLHGCGRFFNALRDTTTDRFSAVYATGSPRPEEPA
jgi:sarcosine oxidase subunit delta